MPEPNSVGPVWRSFLTACIAIATVTTASAAPTAVSELPRAFWGKECFGPAPSRTYPGTKWYVLLRVGADGKTAETRSSYGAPGSETKQSVATNGAKAQATVFSSWDDNTYVVPVRSRRAIYSLFVKFIDDNQFQYATVIGVTGTGDCEKLP